MTLIDHAERYLGTIAEGWRGGTPPSKIQVVRFADQPEHGVSTYLTLGLSNVLLPAAEFGAVAEELLVSVYDHFPRAGVASFLMTLADFIVDQNRAILRGDVIGPTAPVIAGVAANAVYATVPALFSGEFSVFESDNGPIEIMWLIPMPPAEARWVKQHGGKEYESAQMQTDIDFFDLNREPIRTAP